MYIPINSPDALPAANSHGAIINGVAKPFKLDTGMYGLPMASVGILVENSDDRTTLGLDNATSSDNGEVSHLMVVNATDIHAAGVLSLEDDADIITSNATIGTSIN